MPADDNLPVIRRRDGTIRDDIVIAAPPPPAQPQRRPVPIVGRPRHIPAQRDTDIVGPGLATGLATTTASVAHLFRVVLSRYLVVAGVLAIAAWAVTKLVWAGLTVGALPLLVFLWYTRQVLRQAKQYRRGEAGPPPGYLGKF